VETRRETRHGTRVIMQAGQKQIYNRLPGRFSPNMQTAFTKAILRRAAFRLSLLSLVHSRKLITWRRPFLFYGHLLLCLSVGYVLVSCPSWPAGARALSCDHPAATTRSGRSGGA